MDTATLRRKLRHDGLISLDSGDLFGLRDKLGGSNPLSPSRPYFWRDEAGGPVYDTVVAALDHAPDEYALTPASIRTLLALVEAVGATRVLELGSGLSTLVMARHFAAGQGADGHILAVDEDAGHVSAVQHRLEATGGAGNAAVMAVPLVPCDAGRLTTRTYDHRVVAARHPPAADFDLLFIDGPRMGAPGGTAWSRLPTLPFFRPWLRAGALVVLDDALRDMELEIIRLWEREGLVQPLGVSLAGQGLYLGRIPGASATESNA